MKTVWNCYSRVWLYVVILLPGQLMAQENRLSLSGRVLDSVSSRQLVDAELYLSGPREYHVHSDREGLYRFDSVAPGLYQLQVMGEGYHLYNGKVYLTHDRRYDILLCPMGNHLHELRVVARSVFDGQSSASIVKLGQVELNQDRGQNLGEMLKNIPGVTVLSTGSAIAKPVIRGLHSQRIVTMNAGVKQEGQQWGADHGPEIDPFSVQKVELVRGASSVQYGSDAIGGVVKVSPRALQETPGISGEVSLNAFSNNRQGAGSLMLGGRLGRLPLAWRVQGSYRRAGDSKAPGYVISNTGFEEKNYSAELGYLGKSFKASLYYSHFGSEIGIFRGAHLGNLSDFRNAMRMQKPYYIKPFTYEIGNPRHEVRHDLVTAIASYTFKKAGTLKAQAGGQFNNRKEFDVINPIYSQNKGKPNYDLDLKTGTVDLGFEHNKTGHWKGMAGYGYTYQTNSASGLSFIIPNFLVKNHGLFLIEKYSRGRWFAELGIRYDHRRMITLRQLNNVLQRNEHNYSNFSLLAGGAYHVSEKMKLSLNLAKAFRPPAINELYSDGLHGGTATYEIGDKNLETEQAYNADLGFEFVSGRLVIEANVYYNYIRNFIYQQPDTQPTLTIRGAFPTLRFKQADAAIRGTELSAEYMFAPRWKASMAISALLGDNLDEGKPLIYMPANRVRAALLRELRTGKKVIGSFVRLSGTYVAKQNRYTEGEDYLPPPPAYFLLDLDLAGNIPVRKQKVMLSLSLRNMLNTSYRDYLSRFRYFTDEPGFNLVLRCTMPFDVFKPN